VHYAPHDVVGGDYCAISRPAPDRYTFIVADVMGHGISAALYTMYLRSLWDEQRDQETPAAILSAMNRRLSGVMDGAGAFATAVCGVLDMNSGRLQLSSAGGPEPLLFSADGSCHTLDLSGVPMGFIEEGEYDQVECRLDHDGRLLLFSDGVVEIQGANSGQLGTDGLLRLLNEMHYPSEDLDCGALEQRLLTYSNRIRFDDDLTFLEIHLTPGDEHAA
jgi:serine phosphatase RsbU (regulator of sigma subunit)